MTLDFLDYIARFQTLIAGVLVFLGVILTLGFNAWSARNERKKSLKLEQYAIRTALIEELKIVKIGLEDGVGKLDGHQDGGVLYPRGPELDIYKALLPKIRLLTPIQVEKVLLAYLSVIQFRENLTLFQSADSQEHHISLPPDAIAATVHGLRNLIPLVNGAISSLSERG